MEAFLQKSSYEKLILQMVYIEENTEAIQEAIMESGLGTSKADIELYFEKYIKRIEALLKEIHIAGHGERLNRLPFVVLDSSFTLRDANNKVYYCHLSNDNNWEENRNLHQIYFLSETGLTLLLKKEGRSVHVDMGNGHMEHTISSIRIV